MRCYGHPGTSTQQSPFTASPLQVLEANARGVYLPLWGTREGFQMIAYLAAGEQNLTTPCSAINKADSVTVAEGASP